MSKPWFGAKTYGIGIGPKSLEGWIATLVYVVLMSAAGTLGRRFDAPPWAIGAAMGVMTLAILALVVIKSDRQPLRWRWGGR